MKLVSVGTALVAVAALFPAAATAQFPPRPGAQAQSPSSLQDRWPDAPKPATRSPAGQGTWQAVQAQPQPDAPAAQPKPKRSPKAAAAKPAPDDGEALAPEVAPKPQRPPPAAVLACTGVFAKNSSHLKLAIKYDPRNIVYDDVTAYDGSKVKASILYPQDPRRRLEVLWNDQVHRSDTQVIAINGKSQWVAPKGLKLGLPIAALEKLNGHPFKLSGFGADGSATVIDWAGGALTTLPGKCQIGMRLIADSKAPEDARSTVAGDNKEFLSNDVGVRAVKPTIGEILVGY